jgi:hypothetical protein
MNWQPVSPNNYYVRDGYIYQKGVRDGYIYQEEPVQ